MKGILKNKEGKWVVKYFIPPTINKLGWINADSHFKELPLHPNDAKQFETGFTDKFTSEVEFEIVAYGNPCKYHKNLLDCKNPPNCDCEFNYVAKLITKQGSFDEDGFGITRVIDDKQEDHFKKVKESITNSTKNSGYSVYIPEEAKKQEETTTSWDEICNLYYNFREENNISHNDVESFEYWLANNYHPPVKK